MALERRIVLAGMSEEEEALLRLLLRKAAPHLKEHWSWGDDEEGADVILTDPLTIAGNVAIGNAKRRGIPYLVISDAPRRGEERWTLRRPPTVIDLARVLNELELREVPTLPVVSAQGHDFYNIDLESEETGARSDGEGDTSPYLPAPRPVEAAPDPEALFRRDPLARAVAVLKTHRLAPDAGLEPVASGSKRAETRALSHGNPFLKDLDKEPPGLVGGRRALEPEIQEFDLATLLKGGVVFGPCEHELPGVPPLVLDPKLDVFHSAATLAQLRLYCRQRFSRSAWKSVTTQRLREIREKLPARSFAQLRFLAALEASRGTLDPKLDPGGSFWLQGVLKLDDSLPQQQRILDAMPEARRLNEIASASGASMAEVMDTVNALLAVGMLGSRLRERLR
jgi:hypothetical protein